MAATSSADDFDFEAEDLGGDESPHTASTLGPPSLIVDDVHVTYRVFGAKIGRAHV